MWISGSVRRVAHPIIAGRKMARQMEGQKNGLEPLSVCLRCHQRIGPVLSSACARSSAASASVAPFGACASVASNGDPISDERIAWQGSEAAAHCDIRRLDTTLEGQMRRWQRQLAQHTAARHAHGGRSLGNLCDRGHEQPPFHPSTVPLALPSPPPLLPASFPVSSPCLL